MFLQLRNQQIRRKNRKQNQKNILLDVDCVVTYPFSLENQNLNEEDKILVIIEKILSLTQNSKDLFRELVFTPVEIIPKEMNTPITPKKMIAMKFRKNSFFLTENLASKQSRVTIESLTQNAKIIKFCSRSTHNFSRFRKQMQELRQSCSTSAT